MLFDKLSSSPPPSNHKDSHMDTYLAEMVYGGIDGSVTTFAVVAGSAGAQMDTSVVIILGLVNLIADGFSMSVGAYLSSRSTKSQYKRKWKREAWEVENLRESEVEEIRNIYRDKGFEGKELEMVVNRITSNKEVWIEDMMKNELNTVLEDRKSWKIGMATFISFIIAGMIPLVSYIIDAVSGLDTNLFLMACILTGASFIIIGGLKSRVTTQAWPKSVLETLLLGGSAATLAYFAGEILVKLF